MRTIPKRQVWLELLRFLPYIISACTFLSNRSHHLCSIASALPLAQFHLQQSSSVSFDFHTHTSSTHGSCSVSYGKYVSCFSSISTCVHECEVSQHLYRPITKIFQVYRAVLGSKCCQCLYVEKFCCLHTD